jgi:hypothetical protein
LEDAEADGKLAPGLNPRQATEAREALAESERTLCHLLNDPDVTEDVEATTAVLQALGEVQSVQLFLGRTSECTVGQAVFRATRTKAYARWGLTPEGLKANPAAPLPLSAKETERAIETAGQIEATGQMWGGAEDMTPLRKAWRSLATHQLSLLEQHKQELDAASYRHDGFRQEAILEQVAVPALTVLATTQRLSVDDYEEHTRWLNLAAETAGKLARAQEDREYQIAVAERKHREILRSVRAKELARALKELNRGRKPNPDALATMQNSINAWLKPRVAPIEAWVNSDKFLLTLADAVSVAEDLLGLAKCLETTSPSAGGAGLHQVSPEINIFSLTIFPKYSAKVTALAKAQRAWWLANRVTQVFLAGLEDKAVGDMTAVEKAAWAASQQTLASSLEVLEALREGIDFRNQLVDIPLPGDITVRKVFGEFYYNKATKVFSGSFGGRVEFPEQDNAYFDLKNAGFSTDGKFNLDLSVGTPQLGGVIIREANFAIQGQVDIQQMPPRPRLDSVGGSVKLELMRGSATNGPIIETRVSYDAVAKKLRFGTDVEDAMLRLTDNFVLFNAGFGLELGQQARSGALSVRGSAGIFKSTNLPPNDVLRAMSDADLRKCFHLVANNLQATLRYDVNAKSFGMRMDRGQLILPEFFTVPLAGGSGLASLHGQGVPEPVKLALDAGQFLDLTFFEGGDGSPPSVRFGGSLTVTNAVVRAPVFQGLGAKLVSATFEFPEINLLELYTPDELIGKLPKLSNVEGVLYIPLPPGKTNTVELHNGKWDLTGLPSGTIELGTDLTVLDLGGFTFTLLGGSSCGADRPATGVTINEMQWVNGLPQAPKLEFYGGFRVAVPLSLLQNDNPAPGGGTAGGQNPDQVTFAACGSLFLEPDKLPELSLDMAEFGGSFRCGSFVAIRNATVRLENLRNIFNPDSGLPDPFTITLNGKALITEGPAFALTNAKFVFDNSFPDLPGAPRFEPGSFTYEESAWEFAKDLPFRFTYAQFEFKEGNLPLPELFKPTNIKLTTSAILRIPPGDDPVFEGKVDGVSVTFDQDGVPEVGLKGVGIAIAGLDIPPLDDIGGKVYVGNLDRPEKIFFTGKVGGNYEGYRINLLLAFTLQGPIGVCIDVNAGSVGIPLDGYQLGGILLTGASGGASLANSNEDPCEFTSYMDENGYPKFSQDVIKAPMTWAQLRDTIKRWARQKALFGRGGSLAGLRLEPAAGLSGLSELDSRVQALLASSGNGPIMNEWGIPCPESCPPPTVNIFYQPHPDQARYPNRVIVKFTSIDEPTLNRLGITREKIQEWLGRGGDVAQTAATEFAQQLRGAVAEMIPLPLESERLAEFTAFINEALDQFTVLALEQVVAAINQATGPKTAEAIYGIIKEEAYKGISAPDITLTMSGTLTHQYLMGLLSGEAEVRISTTGAAGVEARVNLIGIPVGNIKGFVAATDKKGNFNPWLCGQLDGEFGPMKLGSVAASFGGFANDQAVIAFLRSLANCLPRADLVAIVNRVAPRIDCTGKTGEQIFAELTRQETTALMLELQNRPPIPDLVPCLSLAIGNAWDNFNPELLLCGQVKPRLCGIPLAPEVASAAGRLSKTNFFYATKFSPSGTVGYFLGLLGGSGSILAGPMTQWLVYAAFAQDDAMFAYTVDWPDAYQVLLASLAGKLNSAAAIANYADEMVDYVLQHGIYTMRYEIHPLGFRTVDVESRFVNPNLTAHPANPARSGGAWIPPEKRIPALPSRYDLLLAAVTNRLVADATWKGDAADMYQAFAEGTLERTNVTGLSFYDDYFPYGGILFGGYVQLPRAVVEAPPDVLYQALSPTNNVLVRLGSAFEYIEDYIITSTTVGALACYLPAASPPFFTDAQGNALSPRQLLTVINLVDPEGIGMTSLYPVEEFFLRGRLEGTLLGIPIGTADMIAVPPNLASNTPAYFRVTAQMPANSWLSNFVTEANLVFNLEHSPRQLSEVWGSNALTRFSALSGDPPAGTSQDEWTRQRENALVEILSGLVTNLAKVSLDAEVKNLHVPTSWGGLVSVPDNTATFHLLAFSPEFDPGFVGTGPVAEVRRHGGIALKGKLRFGPYVEVENAELAAVPRLPSPDNYLVPPDFYGLLKGVAVRGLPGGLNCDSAELEFSSSPLALHGQLASTALAGFEVKDVAVDFVRSSTQTNLALAATLDVANFPGVLEFEPRLSGNVTKPGSVYYVHLKLDGQTIKVLGYPFTGLNFALDGPINGTALLNWKNAVLDQAKFGFLPSLGLQGSLDSAGKVSMSTNLPTIKLGAFSVSGATLSLNNAKGLQLSAAKVTAGNLFEVNLPNVSLPPAGLTTLSRQLSLPNLPLFGFSLGSVSFVLDWSAGSISVRDLAATLPQIPGIPGWANVPFSGGTIDNQGVVSLSTTLPGLTAGIFKLQNIQAGFANGLKLSDGQLKVGGRYGLTLPLGVDVLVTPGSVGPIPIPCPPLPQMSLFGFNFGTPTLTFHLGSSSVVSLHEQKADEVKNDKTEAGKSATSASYLDISNAKLNLSPLPSARLPFSGTIQQDGQLNLALPPQTALDSFFGFPAKLMSQLSAGGGKTYADFVLADGPEAYWRLGETSYNKDGSLDLADATKRHPILLSPVPLATNAVLPGWPGALIYDPDKAFAFTGNAQGRDVIPVGDEAAFDITGPLTIELWLKGAAFDKPWQGIVTKGDSSWRLHRYADTDRLSFGTSAADGAHDLPSTRSVADGKWHHVVATFDGATKKLYIDGQLDASAAWAKQIRTNDAKVWIGGNADYPNERVFKGLIDEVAIYKKALSSLSQSVHFFGGAAPIDLSVQANLQLGPLAPIQLGGSVAADGRAELHAANQRAELAGLPFWAVSLDFIRDPGQSAAALGFAAKLDANGFPSLSLPWRTGSIKILSLGTTTPSFQGQVTYNATRGQGHLYATASDQDVYLLGYHFNGTGFTVNRDFDATGETLEWLNAQLKDAPVINLLPGLPKFSGRLGTNNLHLSGDSLPVPAPRLGGFTGSGAQIRFNASQGLNLGAKFDLKAAVGSASVDFGDLDLSGGIAADGALALVGNGTLNLMGFGTESAAFKLSADGLRPGGGPLPKIIVGSFRPEIQDFRLTANGLASLAAQSVSSSTGWKKFYDWLPWGSDDTPGDVSAKVSWTVSFARTDQGGFGATASATLTIQETKVGGYNQQSYTKSASVGSDGSISISQPFKTLKFELRDPDGIPFSGDEFNWYWENSAWTFDLW